VIEGNDPGRSRSGWLKSLVVVAAFMVVLAVASTAAVLVAGGPRQADYPTGTPEAAFQAFVKAVNAGDWTTADGLMSANLKSQGITAQQAGAFVTMGSVSVSIQSSSTTGSQATLSVDYKLDIGATGLVSSSVDMPSTVRMVLEPGGWKLDSQLGGY
jgi:hypothetical protein